jgi:hypothetical protein
MGDTVIALGPRPGRKWAGVGVASLAVAGILKRMGYKDLALAASLVSVAANALMLAAFRQPERPVAVTVGDVSRSWLKWGAGAVALVVASNKLGQVR